MFEILMSEILNLNEDVLYLNAIAAILLLLIVRMHKQGSIRLLPKLFDRSRGPKELSILSFKKCPQCADQLPVSALVCDACDYNFLAGSILRHKLLPASESGIHHESTHVRIAHLD